MTIERTELFNRARILWCCQQNGIEVSQLADGLKMSPRKLDAALYENGSLTISQVQDVAEYFHRDLLFFFESGEVDEERVDSVQFRTINNQKPTLARKIRILVKRAEEQRQIFVDLLEEDEEETRWTANRIRIEPKEAVKSFANRVRMWLKLEDKNSFESYRLALEKAGLLVFVSNGYGGKWQIEKTSPIRGFSLYFDASPVIVAKKQASPAAQAFTVMHELGHLLLHSTSCIDDEQDFYNYHGREREANDFAGNILVPDYLLNQIDLAGLALISVDKYDEYLSDYRTQWGVSGDVIIRRLSDEGYIEARLYQDYLAHKRGLPRVEPANTPRLRYRDNRDKEPLNIFGRTFVSVVFNALHTEQITVNKASKYLDNLKITDLRKLERRIVHF